MSPACVLGFAFRAMAATIGKTALAKIASCIPDSRLALYEHIGERKRTRFCLHV